MLIICIDISHRILSHSKLQTLAHFSMFMKAYCGPHPQHFRRLVARNGRRGICDYKFREDVTEQMLLCFLTWAYYGDYHSSNGDIVPSPVDSKAQANGLEDRFGLTSTKRSKKDKKKPEPVIDLEDQSWSPPHEVAATEASSGEYGEGKAEKAYEGSLKYTSLPLIFAKSEDNVAHPLLLNVKLYVFADTYLIKLLKASAKQKMIDYLQKFGSLSGGDERAAVFDILAYAFPRLPETDLLLHWLARYASWTLEELKQMPTRFDDLLSDEDRNFAKILLRYFSKSTIDPFNLKDDDITPRYPMPMAKARYDIWRGS